VKLLAFGASNSRTSINKALAIYAASLVKDAKVKILDLNEYDLPIYSEDLEKEMGIPEAAQRFYSQITEADAIVISFAEHNGIYTAVYKNIFDWSSRINMKVYQGKAMILLATSPGLGGAKNVLANATQSIPHFGGVVKGNFSVPSFYDNFDIKKGKFINQSLQRHLNDQMQQLSSAEKLNNMT